MQIALYFLKRLFNFLKIDIILLKSVGKTKILLYLATTSLIWGVLFFYNQDKNIKNIIFSIQDAIYWSAFIYFFHRLKKQNFFYHLILNRGFYKTELEILLFLLSIYIFFISFNIIFVYFSTNETKSFIITTIQILIDAFLIEIWQIWKYILLMVIFFSCTLFSFMLQNEITASNVSSFLLTTNNSNSTTLILIFIELIILFRIIKNTDYLK